MTQPSTALAPHSSYLVLLDREGEVDWLGQFDDLSAAQTAMAVWLQDAERGDEDAAFILPVIAWGRAQTLTAA